MNPGYVVQRLGKPTFSIEISEISEAFPDSRKSRNIFPDIREFRKILTTNTGFGPIPNIIYYKDVFFIVVIRRMFQKRRDS